MAPQPAFQPQPAPAYQPQPEPFFHCSRRCPLQMSLLIGLLCIVVVIILIIYAQPKKKNSVKKEPKKPASVDYGDQDPLTEGFELSPPTVEEKATGYSNDSEYDGGSPFCICVGIGSDGTAGDPERYSLCTSDAKALPPSGGCLRRNYTLTEEQKAKYNFI